MYQFSLSIIIPIYNVENYIAHFLESLLPQLNNEVECIFINDGTQDNSMTILEQYINRNNKNSIRIINQKNQGQSIARNNGLKLATGKYIGYLDPDDYVDNSYIESILMIIKKYDFDILHFNAIKINQKNNKENLHLVNQESLLNIDDTYLRQLFEKKLWFPWLRVIRKDLLENFTFPQDCIMEDMLAFPFLYKKAKKIYELDKSLVFYQYRQDSAMNSQISTRLINSLDYGVQKFRPYSEDKHLGILYRSFVIESLFKKSKLSYEVFLKGFNNYQNDINMVKLHLDKVHWKKRIMLNYPKSFFFYNRINAFLKGKNTNFSKN